MLNSSRITRSRASSKSTSITRPLSKSAEVSSAAFAADSTLPSTSSATKKGTTAARKTLTTTFKVGKDTGSTNAVEKKKNSSSAVIGAKAVTAINSSTAIGYHTILPNLSPSSIVSLGTLHILSKAPELQTYITSYPQLFQPLITAHEPLPPSTTLAHHYFRSISRGIIAQQVSNAAAASILAKFDALFSNPSAGSEGPTPQEVLAMPIETLRSAGLSGRKAEYMHSLSNFFTTQYNSLPNNTPFTALSDEAIIDLLVTVKGIGRWSAQMFLLFGMGRWDVFAGGDLGIQRGIAVWKHGKEGGEKFAKTKPGKGRFLSDEKLAEIVGPFTPYRSLLCLLLWRVGDTRVDALGQDVEPVKTTKRVAKKKKVVEEAEDEGEVGPSETAKPKRTRKKIIVEEELQEEEEKAVKVVQNKRTRKKKSQDEEV